MPKKAGSSPRRGKSHAGPVTGPSYSSTPNTKAGLNSQMKSLHNQKAAAKAAHDPSQIKEIRNAMRANKQMRANMIARKKAK